MLLRKERLMCTKRMEEMIAAVMEMGTRKKQFKNEETIEGDDA